MELQTLDMLRSKKGEDEGEEGEVGEEGGGRNKRRRKNN